MSISFHLPRTRRARRVLAFLLASVMIGGAAFAYWTGTGAGTGSATSTTAGTVVVNQTGSPTNVNPGRAAQSLSGTFTNTSGTSVYVTSVTASISGVTKANGAAAGTCDSTDYVLSNPTTTVGQDIAAGATAAGSWSGPTIAFNNKATNQDQCKGATIAFSYTSN